MLRAPVRAVIFDCDGTLVDSEVPGMDVLHQLAVAEGLALTRAEAHARFRGVRMAAIVGWIASRLPRRSADFEAAFTARVRAAMAARFAQGLSPLPGAQALLRALAVPYGVATNGPREKVEQTLGVTGLRHFFGDRVFSAYEVGHFKPAPGLFLHAAMALGQRPADCVVVEDSLTGVQAALAAGMQVLALCPPEDLPGDVARQVCRVDGLPDVGHHLDAIGCLRPGAPVGG